MFTSKKIALCGLALLVGIASEAVARDKVKVRYDRGDSISAVLEEYQSSTDELIIEVQGMCEENVVISRDHVTLKGTDPLVDGIQAPSTAKASATTLIVRNASYVRLENLTLAGGEAMGLNVINSLSLGQNTGADDWAVEVDKCRFVDNGEWGFMAQDSSCW